MALRPKTLAIKNPPLGGLANNPTAIVRGRSSSASRRVTGDSMPNTNISQTHASVKTVSGALKSSASVRRQSGKVAIAVSTGPSQKFVTVEFAIRRAASRGQTRRQARHRARARQRFTHRPAQDQLATFRRKIGGFMNFDQRRDTKRSPSEWPTGSAGRKIAGADLWA